MNITHKKSRPNCDAEVNATGWKNHASRRQWKKKGASLLFTLLALIFGSFAISAQNITVTPLSLSFGTVVAGSGYSIVDSVLIINSSSATVNYTYQYSGSSYIIQPSPLPNSLGNDTVKIYVEPQSNLPVGIYNDTIKIDTGGIPLVEIPLSFTVESPDSIAVSTPNKTVSFGSLPLGFITLPSSAQSFTIKNVGTNDIAINSSNPSFIPRVGNYFAVTQPSPSNLTPGNTATFTVKLDTINSVPLPTASGVYKDTIIIRTTKNGVDTVFVDFKLDSYIISADKDTLSFGSKQSSYTSTTAQTVLIKNAGSGQLTLTQPQNTANFEIGTLSKLNLKPSDAVPLSVKPKVGLQEGTYLDSIIIVGNYGASDTVYFQFTVTKPLTYEISLSPNTLSFIDTLNNINVASLKDSIEITNDGTDTVKLTLPSNPNYTFSYNNTPVTTIAIAPDSTAILYITPEPQLATKRTLGTYSDQITILGNNGITEVINVTYEVVKEKYSIEVTTQSGTSNVDFGKAVSPYTPPAEQAVTIKNTGSSPITLTITATSATDYDVDTLHLIPSGGHILPSGASVNFYVQPKGNLLASATSYDQQITINVTEDNSLDTTLNLKFSVESTSSTDVDITSSLSSAFIDFDSLPTPYTPPAAETFKITNSGADTVALSYTIIPSASNFDVTFTPTTPLKPGDAATFTVRPKGNLSVHEYNDTLKIIGTSTNSAISPDTIPIPVSFKVISPTYIIKADTTQWKFDPAAEPYTPPTVKIVTITNTGTGDITLTTPTLSTSDFYIGALSAITLTPGTSATFDVQPKADLSPGLHKDKITVTGNNGAKVEINVEFTVTTYAISASPLTSFGSVLETSPGAGATITTSSSKTFTITNTGTDTVWVSQPVFVSTNTTNTTNSMYTISTLTGVPIKLIPGAKVDVDVALNVGINLQVGSYTELISITCQDASNNILPNVSATVTADFTVSDVQTVAIEALPQIYDFGQLQIPYAQPAAQTFTITNIGTEDITSLNYNPNFPSYNVTTLPSSALPLNSGDSVIIKIQPKANLTAGTYNISIPVEGSASGNNSIVTIQALFTVIAATPPTVKTDTATNVSQTSAKIYKVVTKGTETISEQGFEYRIMGDTRWTRLASAATSVTLTGLKANRLYEFRAYATTASGTWYSSTPNKTFKTLSNANVPVPENDHCLSATALYCGSNWEGTTEGATEKDYIGYAASHYGVWYVFRGDGEKTTITSKAKPGLDHKMIIYTGLCNSLTYLTDKDEVGYGETETCTFNTVDSTIYYVYIAHNNASGGSTETGEFSISRTCYNYPSVTTLDATDVTSTSATLNMLVTPGWETIVSTGFWYRVSLTNDWYTSADGVLIGLTPNTQYDFYAFAMTMSNNSDTLPNNFYYGATLSFTTLGNDANDLIRSDKIVVYPNPALDRLTIESGSSDIENATAEIYDMLGRRVISHKLSEGNTINVSNLSSGLYIIKIGNRASKFIKE